MRACCQARQPRPWTLPATQGAGVFACAYDTGKFSMLLRSKSTEEYAPVGAPPPRSGPAAHPGSAHGAAGWCGPGGPGERPRLLNCNLTALTKSLNAELGPPCSRNEMRGPHPRRLPATHLHGLTVVAPCRSNVLRGLQRPPEVRRVQRVEGQGRQHGCQLEGGTPHACQAHRRGSRTAARCHICGVNYGNRMCACWSLCVED